MKYIANDHPVLVIGYGNILRRDDGVGWAAARRLADQLPADLALVLAVPQLLPELADRISRALLVIFIDADAQLAPGQMKKRVLRPRKRSSQPIVHHQTPAEMLRLAHHVYQRSPRALLYSVGGSNFSFGCSLSAPVRSALRNVVRDVVQIVVLFLQRRGLSHA